MIPYFEWHTIPLGPITLQVWGLFVALGFLLGAVMAGRLAKARGDDPKIVYDLAPWLVLAGLVGGRLGDVVFYRPAFYLANPLEILMLWHGGSSFFGGLIACILVGFFYLKKKKVDIWRYAEAGVYGLPFGMFIGRIGCFLIHDHPGTATHFILGVKYPDGVVRHDLGLYESLNGLVMALVFLWLSRKPRPVGTYISIFSIWYGVTRFFFDFLRTADAKYFGLTPAQYLSVGMVVFGIWLAHRTLYHPLKPYITPPSIPSTVVDKQ